MCIPAAQRRALREIEKGIRVSDPGLASLLGIFGRLHSDEKIPPAEQLRGRQWSNLAFPPCRLTDCGNPLMRSLVRCVTALPYLFAVAAVVSTIITGGGSQGSAHRTSAAVSAARQDANISSGLSPAQPRFPRGERDEPGNVWLQENDAIGHHAYRQRSGVASLATRRFAASYVRAIYGSPRASHLAGGGLARPQAGPPGRRLSPG
jgi:hypothetical protein